MTNWLRDPTLGPGLIQDEPHLTDTFHRTVGRGLFKECDAITLAMYQAHSEIHVIYFLLGQVYAHDYEYKSNPPRYVRRYSPIEGWDQRTADADQVSRPMLLNCNRRWPFCTGQQKSL